MKKSICVITTIELSKDKKIPWKHTRTVGWFSNFKLANECVVYNYGDIWEGSFNYVVIEVIQQGLYPFPTQEHWYLFNKEKMRYERTKKPEQLKNITCFGIG